MRRTGLALIAVLLAWGLLAAACGDDADEAPEAASDEFAGTIRLGAALSETGKYSVEGRDARQGYDTWVRWVNEIYGGIRVGDERYAAEIVYYDDESDADTAANLVQRLIDEDGVDFLLGPYSSSITTGTSAIAEANDVLMVTANGTSDTMFGRGFRNLFLVATLASDYTKSGIEALAAAGAETAVIAYEDTSFPTAVANGAVRHLEANGIEMLAVETYPKDIQDVSAIMTKFRDLDPDIFVGGGHYNDAVLFVNSAKELDFAPDGMLITVGPSNPKLTDELGADVYGVLGPTQWEASMAYEGPHFGSASDFAEYYESLWGEPPGVPGGRRDGRGPGSAPGGGGGRRHRYRRGARRAAIDVDGHVLRADQLRRARRERRQADGHHPGAGRRDPGGGARRGRGGRAPLPPRRRLGPCRPARSWACTSAATGPRCGSGSASCATCSHSWPPGPANVFSESSHINRQKVLT